MDTRHIKNDDESQQTQEPLEIPSIKSNSELIETEAIIEKTTGNCLPLPELKESVSEAETASQISIKKENVGIETLPPDLAGCEFDCSTKDLSIQSDLSLNEAKIEESTKFLKSPSSNERNNWINLLQWIQCMCVVTFDLNLGQVLEYVYPTQLELNEQETTNLCYLAFPDSNSSCMGDTQFHVRFRIAPDSRRTYYNEDHNLWLEYNQDCPIGMKADVSHYWGFVYFRQKRDALLPRGYFQKSFVIVTRLPFINLYYELVMQLANKYFLHGEEVLRQACHDINERWPSLIVGQELNLVLFDSLYKITIPSGNSRKKTREKQLDNLLMAQLNLKEIGTESVVIPSVIELELFHSIGFVLKHLYTLWELVLTAEPIVVIGTSPADCSQMVQSMVALIAPLEYCAEYRPFFTIHDSEFKEFTREHGNVPPSIILGVTNPFFIKLLKDWPHLLRLPDTEQILSLKCYRHSKMKPFSSSNLDRNSQPSNTSNSINNTPAIFNVSGIGSEGSGGAPGLYTKYKPYLKRDKTLIKKILMGMSTKRPDHVQTALIRRNLLELTQSFMIPLERYVASLMPLQKDISPFKATPNAHNFKLDDFLATLESAGPQLTSPLKGDWKGLYRRFFNSPNFRCWYSNRHKALQCTLQELQLQALSEVNLEKWAMEKHEVEIIDMILNLKQKLKSCHNVTNKTNEQIRAQINCIKNLLPNDLKDVANI